MGQPDRKTFQVLLSEVDSITIEGNQVVISRRSPRRRDFREVMSETSLKKWWLDEGLPFLLQRSAQVWINQRGARIGYEAHVSVEVDSHEMEGNRLEGKLNDAFKRSQGRSFTTDQIVERLIPEVKGLERKSASNVPWGQDYLEYLIDILAQARQLSLSKTTNLKSKLYQETLPVVS